MATSTKKIYAAQFIRCGSTFTRELLSELDDFVATDNSHYFGDAIYKNQITVCPIRDPITWYFSIWNYGRQRHRGDFYRLINSRLFRLKHLKRSWRNNYFSNFKIFVGLFISIKNPHLYEDDNNFFEFVKLVNSKKFKYILGAKDYKHNQGIMFDWLCLACFSGSRKIYTHKNTKEFFKRNSMIKNFIPLHNMIEPLLNILVYSGYKREYLEKKLRKVPLNNNRTKFDLNIENYIDDEIRNYIYNKESFILKVFQDIKI